MNGFAVSEPAFESSPGTSSGKIGDGSLSKALLKFLLVGTLIFLSMSTVAQARSVLVPNYKSDTISIIESTTNLVEGSIDMPEDSCPAAAVHTPDGSQIYVLSQPGCNDDEVPDRNTVTVVDTASGMSVDEPIELENSVFRIVISPDGRYLYVANREGTISVIDTEINLVTRKAHVQPDGETEMTVFNFAVSPDGAHLYIPDTGARRDSPDVEGGLIVLDTSKIINPSHFEGNSCVPTEEGEFCTVRDARLGKVPTSFSLDISFTPDGSRAWVSSLFNVALLDPVQNVITTRINVGDFLPGSYVHWATATSPDGNRAFVTSIPFEDGPFRDDDAKVTAFDAKRVEETWTTDIPAGVPFEIALTPDSRYAYLPISPKENEEAGTVVVLDTTNGRQVSEVELESLPGRIAIEPNQGPRAALKVNSGHAGTPTRFDAGDSSDSDGTVEEYRWDFGDGSPVVTGDSPTTSHTYERPGRYTASVTVTDNEGGSTEVVYTGHYASHNGSAAATESVSFDVGANSEPAPPQPPGSPPQPSSTPSMPTPGIPRTLSPSAYKNACTLKITSPKVKRLKKRSRTLRVSRRNARRLFMHGAKGHIKWGKVAGKEVKCEKVRMLLLQKRGRRYYVPGTKRRVSKKSLSIKRFNKTIRRLKKRGIGKLRQRRVTSNKKTKFSFKDFNRRSRLGRKALNKLRKKRYRGTFVFVYTAQIDGKTIGKEVKLRAK